MCALYYSKLSQSSASDNQQQPERGGRDDPQGHISRRMPIKYFQVAHEDSARGTL
jgi:hypothetical protein